MQMDDLFEKSRSDRKPLPPLAARLRPRTLEEIVGQSHILGPGKLLRRAIEADRLGSIILYGPPGCGKTSLAEVIARVTHRHFERTSGVLANVNILRDLLETAQRRRAIHGEETILFIDEIHRFNKAQQDVLLPYVEDGSITLIGATTHNPFFFINSPLTSRSQIFQLEPLSEADIVALLRRALTHPEGLGDRRIEAEEAALQHWAAVCEGDARRALNALEIAALTTPADADGVIRLTRAVAEESIQKKAVVYDHDEDGHYDTISAFIKSVRGSDPNAALYWLAKMLYAGEDPRFIARRLIILASEDIGNADPLGLPVAVAAMEAVDFVGMPEARIILAQATTYLACAPKSNASYLGIESALADVKAGRVLPVPRHLRDASHKKAAEILGHTGYKYAHDYPGHVVDQEYVPTDKVYYEPTEEGFEKRIRERLARWAELRRSPSTRTTNP
ncbi:MAG: replication-associated recombination protein A [Kiritimatiellae bacterium]|nr:replication-associated recombination protein A [Kiritimatiellia bacterium]MDW8458861.1 replication-associated recombination protein A [Verrucomicrobiota bacterium]